MADDLFGILNSLSPQEPSFVERMYRDNYPKIDNLDGSISTHKMAWGQDEQGFYAFPTIIERDGRLEELGSDAADKYAHETGELKRFPSQEEAAAYARGSWKQDIKSSKRKLQDVFAKILLGMK